LTSEGEFDYQRYKEIQTKGNKIKINNVWVLEENVKYISEIITRIIGQPTFGICHGTRNGKEQEWFSKYLNCMVIGTEISDTAEQYPNTIQWDFHDTKPEWINSVDFIYSNSFDHSYDPERCLNTWISCLKPGGICILEHSRYHTPKSANSLDPFGAHLTIMPFLIASWGKGVYGLREMVDAPLQRMKDSHTKFLIIQKFENPIVWQTTTKR
jgi:SAM-dependent methyltransferase